MNVGSLFSGIGGIELGFEREGFKTEWFVENDLFCQAVLKKHWPHTPIYGDIKTIDFTKLPKVDIITGGFPCQDISIAGKQKGIKGERSGLWKEYARAIVSIGPTWVVVENVPELAVLGLGQVRQDLWDAGYAPLRPMVLEAADFGAPHKRKRIFQLAHINCNRCNNPRHNNQEGGIQSAQSKSIKCACLSKFFCPDINSFSGKRHIKEKICREYGISWWYDTRSIEELFERRDIPKPLMGRGIYGLSQGLDRVKSLGNAVVPQCAQFIARQIKEAEGVKDELA